MNRIVVLFATSMMSAAFLISYINITISFCILAILSIILIIVSFKRNTVHIQICLLGAIIGILLYNNVTINSYIPQQQLINTEVSVTAKILDINKSNGESTRYLIEIISQFDIDNMQLNMFVNDDVNVDYYDTVECNIKLKEVKSTPIFDFNTFYKSKGIFLTATGEITKIVDNERDSLLYKLAKLNDKLCYLIESNLKAPSSYLLDAMILGDTSKIDDATSYYMTNSGVVHIVSVSGLHVGIIATFLLLALKKLILSRRISAIFIIVIVWCYALLTGFSIPTVRSAIMTTLMLIGKIILRSPSSNDSLFIAGSLIFIFSPYAITDLSFLLTFLSTLGILLYSERIYTFLLDKIGVEFLPIKYIIKAISTTIPALFLTIPIAVIFFKSISLVGIIANIFIIPLTTIIIIIGTLLLPFLLLHANIIVFIIFKILEILIQLMIYICKLLGSIPYASYPLNFDYVVPIMLVFAVVFFIFFAFYNSTKSQIIIIECFIISLLSFRLCSLVFNINTPIKHIIDVNGDTAIVTIYKQAAVVLSNASSKRLGLEVAKYLNTKGVHVISSLILNYESIHTTRDLDILQEIIIVQRVVQLYD